MATNKPKDNAELRVEDLATTPKRAATHCPHCKGRLPTRSSVSLQRYDNCKCPTASSGVPPPDQTGETDIQSGDDIDPEASTVKVAKVKSTPPTPVVATATDEIPILPAPTPTSNDADSSVGTSWNDELMDPETSEGGRTLVPEDGSDVELHCDPASNIPKTPPPIPAGVSRTIKPNHRGKEKKTMAVNKPSPNDKKSPWPWIIGGLVALMTLGAMICAGLLYGGSYHLLGFGDTPLAEAKVEPPPAPAPVEPTVPISPIEITSTDDDQRPEGPLILDCGGKWPTSGPDTYRFDFVVDWSVLGQESYYVSGIHPAKGLAGIIDGACVSATGHTVPVDRITQVRADRPTKVWLAFEDGQPPRGEHHAYDIVVRCDKSTHSACVEKQLAKR